MNLTASMAQYLGLFIMGLDLLIKLIAIYAMYIAIKAFKIYIKKN